MTYLLRKHLLDHGYERVGPKLVGDVHQRSRRGGVRPWLHVRKDIIRHLKEDRRCISTTMVDYYGLPRSRDGAWPGHARAAALAFGNRAAAVEKAVFKTFAPEWAEVSIPPALYPFVVMHEFEGLLFSDRAAFARGLQRPDVEAALQAIRNQFATPEEINDSPTTAPPKRLVKLIPRYQKPLLGVRAASEIGLQKIAEECPHFRNWLTILEARAARA